ncbi:hypothetical protein QBC40DRAFT_253395 [Triangularia verruculosa]|uniref:Uncharacterized protein n=1 Tax=Triangularia verruculosa TaxID=2587418 RepID=A0AAN6XIF0_9PEZI|nr:hypothetical protein QBC40DRAFT_253395 [Triangularia verruculosa]
MRSSTVIVSLLVALTTASPIAPRQPVSVIPPLDIHRRDGATEFDPDFAFRKDKRDGTTEFDPDFAFKKDKRDGTTEFDLDFAF